jgi:hypothetical protein
VARAQQAPAGEDTRVVVLPGLYRGQSVDLDGRRLHGRLTVTGQGSDPAAYPTFAGDGSGTWLRYRGAEGRDTGLTLRALRIARYATAITLNGNRNDPAAFNRGTVLENLVLAQIGSDTTNGAAASTAAIRLVNAQDTVVRGVFFHTIRNTPRDKCGGCTRSIWQAMPPARGSRATRSRISVAARSSCATHPAGQQSRATISATPTRRRRSRNGSATWRAPTNAPRRGRMSL